MLPLSTITDTPPQWRDLYQEMEDKLAVIHEETKDRLTMIRLSLAVCRTAVELLKNNINSYIFHSVKEEIYFFKEVKPAYYSHLIYYLKLFNIESGRPAGNNQLWETYLNRIQERLQYFFDNNMDFYQYYRSGGTYLDDQYFRRGRQEAYLKLDDYYFSYDASFSTSQDLKVAKLLANEKLFTYVSSCLFQIRSGETTEAHVPASSDISWTATKAALIELLYALQSAGVFNNGASDLKQLASYFEQTFNIELGNYYHVFQEIRLRKKNRTSFLDQLKERLTKRMDEADDNRR